MWRKLRWSTILYILIIVILSGNLLVYIKAPVKSDCNKDNQAATQHEQRDVRPKLPSNDGQQKLQSKEKKEKKKRDFVLVSEMEHTTHQWPWPDAAKVISLCQNVAWTPVSQMPDVSIIISFHNNENVFSILHTLHAVVKHTPAALLREIILIDDNTEKDEFRQILKFHIEEFVAARVRLFHSKVSLGLIKARLKGIRAAVAPVVVVMDSHVEPQKGWLEPLLHTIKKNRKTLATPYLDWMQKMGSDWQYRHGASSWKTYFDWTLTFGFQALSPKAMMEREADLTQPVRCAVTVGTVWAMDKAWFEEVGEFDEGMLLWGGENIDLAVRVWLFGGEVVNVPCSHVAHLESQGSRDYRNSWTDVIQTNYKRFAEVWMDEYKEYFYQHIPKAMRLETGDISSRMALKSRALHNFTWYLNNILPELGIPDKGSLAWGGVESLYEGRLPRCLDSMYSFNPRISLCNPSSIATQGYFWTEEGLLRLPIHVLNTAGDSVVSNEYTSFYKTGQAVIWFHIRDGPIINTLTGQCVEMTATNAVILAPCNDKPAQKWRFLNYSPQYKKMMSSRHSLVPEFAKYLNQSKLFITREFLPPLQTVEPSLPRKAAQIENG